MDEQLSTPESEAPDTSQEVIEEPTAGSEVDQNSDDSSSPQESQPQPEQQPMQQPGETSAQYEKRVNDLMSKWQSAESQNKKLQERLDELENRFTPQEKQPWDDPNWQPQSYAELLELAEKRAVQRVQSEQAQKEQARAELQAKVDAQLQQLREEGKTFDEQELYNVANEFKINDLTAAYKILEMRDKAKLEGMSEGQKDAQRKAEQSVASSSKSDAPSSKGLSYSDLRSRNFDDIPEEYLN